MLAAALLALVQATSAPPSPTTTDSDARCIVVFGYAGSHGTPEQAEMTKRGILYFVGKLRGRSPGIDIASTVVRAAGAAQRAGLNAQAEGQRCTAEIAAAGAALRGIGAAAAGSGAASPTPPRP